MSAVDSIMLSGSSGGSSGVLLRLSSSFIRCDDYRRPLHFPFLQAKTTAAVKEAKEKAKKKPASGTRPRQAGPAQKVQIPKQQKQAMNMQRRK